MTEINLNINDQNMSVDTDPDTPLIYVLRNDFEFKGAKLGCALEQCGACIVLVDGEPTNSCVRAAAERSSPRSVMSCAAHVYEIKHFRRLAPGEVQ